MIHHLKRKPKVMNKSGKMRNKATYNIMKKRIKRMIKSSKKMVMMMMRILMKKRKRSIQKMLMQISKLR